MAEDRDETKRRGSEFLADASTTRIAHTRSTRWNIGLRAKSYGKVIIVRFAFGKRGSEISAKAAHCLGWTRGGIRRKGMKIITSDRYFWIIGIRIVVLRNIKERGWQKRFVLAICRRFDWTRGISCNCVSIKKRKGNRSRFGQGKWFSRWKVAASWTAVARDVCHPNKVRRILSNWPPYKDKVSPTGG